MGGGHERISRVGDAPAHVDSDNLFMLGFSRGGLMTSRALTLNLPIRAAAIVSGLSNMARQLEYRPDMREEVYKKLFPDFETREAEHYRLRSAVEWADRIQAPLLLIHGTADDRVRADDAIDLAAALFRAKRPFALVVFDGDGHGVPRTSSRPTNGSSPGSSAIDAKRAAVVRTRSTIHVPTPT
jgi:dipeptidyl aminopeptidase/acylaminoacyl peptidase